MDLDRSELSKALSELAFDVHYFLLYSRLLREGRAGTGTCYQAILYCVLLHFRLLVEFFYNTPHDDDCCVIHFRELPDFALSFPANLERSAELRKVGIDLNKRLAHFTATRWRVRRPSLAHYQKHFNEMTELVRAFREALPGDLKNVFDAGVNVWEHQSAPSGLIT